MKSLPYLVAFLLVSVIACQVQQTHSDFDMFTGRWSLHIVESQSDSTSSWLPRQDHYKNRQGYILYDGLGGMGVHHVTEDYEHYELEGTGGLDSLTPRDLRHLANNFVYFGRYVVIDSVNVIEHHIESAINPASWGNVAKRRYVFAGDTLILNPLTDRYPKIRLKWVRVKDEG